MFYLVPPAGTPVSCRDMIRIGAARLHAAEALIKFTSQIKNHSRVKHCFFVNSGRSAQTLILNALKQLSPDKNEVIIPAYTCYSVPASIARTGLKIHPVDIDPATLDYDYNRLKAIDFSKVLAINASNLFGLVSNWTELTPLAEKHNVYLIDDAAQTMGAYYQNRASGSFGNAGFYSLDRGKNFTTFSGGILITDNDIIAQKIATLVESLKQPGFLFEVNIFIKLCLYGWLLNPHLYWLPDALPFLGLGKTVYDDTFSITGLSKMQVAAGSVLYEKLKLINKIRTENASRIAQALASDKRYFIPGYKTDNCPAYLRLPILAEDKTERDRRVRQLKKNNISASTMYPDTIVNIEELKILLAVKEDGFPGAKQVVDRLFTLPTHPLVRKRDINKMIECLSE